MDTAVQIVNHLPQIGHDKSDIFQIEVHLPLHLLPLPVSTQRNMQITRGVRGRHSVNGPSAASGSTPSTRRRRSRSMFPPAARSRCPSASICSRVGAISNCPLRRVAARGSKTQQGRMLVNQPGARQVCFSPDAGQVRTIARGLDFSRETACPSGNPLSMPNKAPDQFAENQPKGRNPLFPNSAAVPWLIKFKAASIASNWSCIWKRA